MNNLLCQHLDCGCASNLDEIFEEVSRSALWASRCCVNLECGRSLRGGADPSERNVSQVSASSLEEIDEVVMCIKHTEAFFCHLRFVNSCGNRVSLGDREHKLYTGPVCTISPSGSGRIRVWGPHGSRVPAVHGHRLLHLPGRPWPFGVEGRWQWRATVHG